MTPSEKRNATIIEKYGSWEAYKEFRYLHPDKAEKRSKIASIAGKATKNRTFNDPEKAREAAVKMWEKKRAEDSEV